MPELHFKGKEFVYNHHLSVPYRPILVDAARSLNADGIDGNLIVHGDNLHALKALMPLYAGRIDLIYIDPPYNTGNQTWRYNDNVDSPIIREWLKENPVNSEDMLKHDKWLCMMWPRLVLLKELLAESGTFWMSIDDGEFHRARAVLDEIFGENNFLAEFVWKSRASEDTRGKKGVSEDHEYVLCYRKNPATKLRGADKDVAKFDNPDDDVRGNWRSADLTGLATKEKRPNLHYDLTNPETGITYPCPPKGWRYEPQVMQKKILEKRILWPADANGRPRNKIFINEMKSLFKNASSVITHTTTGHGTKELTQIMGDGAFDFPKPTALIRFVLEQGAEDDCLVLDSFGGSGTTAHAVLSQNQFDGGARRFILVESEDYAEKLTAERVRRVMSGFEFKGTQRTELFNEKITFTSLKKSDQLLSHIESIENLEKHRFDNIKKSVHEGVLTVIGEKQIAEKVDGLGGGFTFCTLGKPVNIDEILQGTDLPSYAALGAWLFHTATGESLVTERIDVSNQFLGETPDRFVWLIYEPKLDFLKSRDAALTLVFAEKITKARQGKKHLVFAPAKYVPNKTLHPMGVEFAPLPFALYRVEK